MAIIANDPTVKAGSWGARTVEKIIRITENALDHGSPIIYLVDSAGARITDQVEMFPGRRGAGRIFHTQVRASGVIPQVCALFGPSAAGGAYIPAFCDFVAMVEGNASMYLGSPRMVEMVVSEKTTLEELGGARMHCAVSGSGHYLAKTEDEAIAAVRRYLSYLPTNWESAPPQAAAAANDGGRSADLGRLVPESERQVFDMRKFIRALADPDSFFEVHALWAREVTVGFARLARPGDRGRRQQPAVTRAVCSSSTPDKAARFVVDLRRIRRAAAVPGGRARFMVGTAVERQGIIRHGARMMSAMTEATVPKICVVVRKAYGASLYAMAWPGFEPTPAGPPDREDRGDGCRGRGQRRLRGQARAAARGRAGRPRPPGCGPSTTPTSTSSGSRPSSSSTTSCQPEALAGELGRRFAAARGKYRLAVRRRHSISPV